MTLRRDNIVTLLALLVIAIALPFAIVDTIEGGRVYAFSRQFLQELPQRFTGPGRLRFILQPMLAIALRIRGGLADAKAGNPPYLLALILGVGRRIALPFARIPSDFEIAPVVKQRVDGFRILPSFVGAGELAGREQKRIGKLAS